MNCNMYLQTNVVLVNEESDGKYILLKLNIFRLFQWRHSCFMLPVKLKGVIRLALIWMKSIGQEHIYICIYFVRNI